MRRWVWLTAILCGVSITGWTQDTATIVGTVMDTTGAVIPGAKVTVENADKGYVRHLVTDSAGMYRSSAVPIGNYTVTAEAEGFQKLVQSGITLSVGQIQRVDLKLSVGQVTQEVTVTGNVPHVQTETAALSDVVTGEQISQLELNGRNFVTLATLVPGAVPDNGLDTSHVGVYGNNNISFNGSRMQYNNWEIDGGNNTDEGSASTFNTYPNLDTIAEFRISTSNYGADMGKHAGATIEVATKSGTRDFHGDAFEFVRNDHFDANDFFINRTPWTSLNVQANCGGRAHGPCNAPKTPLKWNDYGYTLGGPVYIPGHYNTDKSKTFFFWSEDWRAYREGQVISSPVPSLLERKGDFSQCDPKSPNYNPVVASGCVLPTVNGVTYDSIAQIPGVNPQAVTNATDLLNALVPLPNSGPAGWTLASTTATNWRQEQIRVDQNISDKTSAFVRYTQDAWDTLAVPALWTGSSFDTIKTPFEGPGKSAVFHLTHTFTPTLMNEFIMSYTVDHIVLHNQAADSVAGSINRPSNFVLNHFFPANAGNPLLPAVSVGGGGPAFYEDAGNRPWFNSNPIIEWKDNVAWVRGNHQLKFGFFLEKYRKNEQFGTDTQGILTFSGSSPISSGNGLADMFLGNIAQYQEGTETLNGVPVGGYPKGHWRMTDFEPYFQDTWKVASRLTLDLGLRYYWYTRIHDVTRPTVDSGFLPSQFNPAREAPLANSPLGPVIVPGTGHDYTTFGNGLVECGHNGIPPGCQLGNTALNFAPRFGFAWDPTGTGRWSVRGGYGIYFESGNGNEAQAEGGEGNPPVALSPSNFNVVGYSSIVPIFSNGRYSAPFGVTSYTAWPYDQGWPYEQQYSLSVQHQLTNNDLFTVAYVGMLGRHLATGRYFNQIPVGVKTETVPALAGLTGTKPGFAGVPGDAGQTLCNSSGVCNVQEAMIYNEVPSSFFQPYSDYSIFMKQNTAVSSYNALQADYRHTFSHGLSFQAAYTWSHAIDDSTSTYFNSGVDSSNLSRWRATSDLNRTHVLTMNYIYDLPFFKNSGSPFLRQALGGWEVSGITTFFSGEPVNFSCGVQGYNNGIGAGVQCNSVGPVKIHKGTFNDPTYGPTPTWWDPNTITEPTFGQLFANGEPGMFGYLGRNVLTGPGRNNTDLALMKNFSLPWFNGEHSTLQFRWETFDTFNHPQWKGFNYGCSGSPNLNGTPAFGRPCGGATYNLGNGEVNSDWGPRVMQLGLKFIF